MIDGKKEKEVEALIEKYKHRLQKNEVSDFYEDLYWSLEDDFWFISSVTQYFYEKGVDPLEYMVAIPDFFLYGSDINTFTVKGNEIEIFSYAFANCKNLKSIKLPDSLEKIGQYAFENCENLTDINVPKNLKEVAWASFRNCPKETQEKFREFMQ